MPVLPHLTRRDGVYYWRRKVRTFSTFICDLRVSLRTTDRAKAITLSRVLSAVSESIVADLEQDRITLEEARQYLQHVVKSRVTAELDLRQDLRFRYGMPSCELERQIVSAMNEAWDILAEQGIGATISDIVEREMMAAGRTRSEVGMLRMVLDGHYRPMLQSQFGADRRAKDFESVCNRRISGERQAVQLLELFIEGQRAAVAAAAVATPPARALASEVMKGFDPVRATFAPELERPAPPRSEVSGTISSMTGPPPAEAPVFTDQIPLTEPASGQLAPSIDAVIRRMIEFKRNAEEGLEEKTARQYQAFGALFQRVTGKTDVRTLIQPDVVQFRSVLFKLPKSFGKSPSDHTLPIDAILAKAATLPKVKVGLAVGTVNRYVDHASALVAAAKSEGFELHPRLDPSLLRRKEKGRPRDKKRTATREELEILFKHRYWTDPNAGPWLAPIEERRGSGLYWVPLIAAYSGMRREEIAGIGVDYIKEDNGVVFFDVITTTDRRIKTAASKRRVPVHDDLMKLGFLEVVSAARKSGNRLLFPDLIEPKSKIMGRKPGRHMAKLVEEIWGEAGSGLSLNSARHYVQHVLDLDKEVPAKVARDIMGHEGKDVHESVYGDQSPLPALKAAIDRLPSLTAVGSMPR
jgi:integrase